MSMFHNINRDIIIITPKLELLDWVNEIFPDVPKSSIKDITGHDKSNVYLVEELDYPEETVAYLQQNIEKYLEYELMDWCIDKSLWPRKLDWQLFTSWFDFSIQTVVMDTLKKPVLKSKI